MLNKVFKTAYETNPQLKFEVFIHKIGCQKIWKISHFYAFLKKLVSL